MSKKGFGKFLLGATVIGTAAALIAYVKQSQSKEDLMDDFDDFDDDLDEEIYDRDASSNESDDRHYVTIPLDKSAEKTAEEGAAEEVPSETSFAEDTQKTQAAPPVELETEEAGSDEEKEVHAFNLEDETASNH